MPSFLGGLPQPPMEDGPLHFTPAWAGWLSQVQTILYDAGNSGTTAQRPTKSMYIAKPFFDTTLGLPIWWNGTVWVNATGAAV